MTVLCRATIGGDDVIGDHVIRQWWASACDGVATRIMRQSGDHRSEDHVRCRRIESIEAMIFLTASNFIG